MHVNTTVRSSAFDVRFTGDAANAKAAVRPHRGRGPPMSLLSGGDSEPRPPPRRRTSCTPTCHSERALTASLRRPALSKRGSDVVQQPPLPGPITGSFVSRHTLERCVLFRRYAPSPGFNDTSPWSPGRAGDGHFRGTSARVSTAAQCGPGCGGACQHKTRPAARLTPLVRLRMVTHTGSQISHAWDGQDFKEPSDDVPF
jgi:hypothetical protein